jgi:hypothetical protein
VCACCTDLATLCVWAVLLCLYHRVEEVFEAAGTVQKWSDSDKRQDTAALCGERCKGFQSFFGGGVKCAAQTGALTGRGGTQKC